MVGGGSSVRPQMSSRALPASSRKVSALPQAPTTSSEELSKFQADINTLTDKIANLQAQSSSSSSASPFVSNLKEETKRNAKAIEGDKITMLENILAKIVEVDRFVLRKTEPETTEGTAGRRKSRGMDLFTLPTHLHIIDRLVDLHAQSKRVTVIKSIDPNASQRSEAPTASSSSSSSQSADDKGGGNNNKEQIQQLQSSLDTEKELSKKLVNELSSLKTQLEEMNKERMDLTKMLHDEKTASNDKLKDANTKIEEIQTSLNDTMEKLKDTQHKLDDSNNMLNTDQKNSSESDETIKTLKGQIHSYEEIIDMNETKYSNLITALINFSNMIGDKAESAEKVRLLFDSLHEQVRGPAATMGSAILSRLEHMQQEVLQHMAQKDSLENELSSSTLQRNLLSDDLTKLSADHDALKGAYQVIEFELATSHSKSESKEEASKNAAEVDALKQTIEALRTKIDEQNSEIAANTKKIFELEKGAELVIQLTAKIATVQEKNYELEAELKSSKETIEMYKTNCENLKQKIRQLGSGNNDFMDTFEEVMREEMQAMKTAFENKLRLAKEDNEISAQRHKQAIQNLIAMSPSGSRSSLLG